MHGYLAMTRTEFRLFRREPFSVVFVLAFPLMMMVLLAAVFGNKQADARDVQNGMLVIRQMTAEERRRYPARTTPPKRPGRRY